MTDHILFFLNFSLKVFKNIYFFFKRRRSDTFSQSKEDLDIRKWFEGETGFYVDVGAGDPILGSNSYFFYRNGWRGYVIDPLKLNASTLKLFRKHDQVFQNAIGLPGNLKLWIFEPSQYTTSSELVARDLITLKTVKFKKVLDLKSRKLSGFDLQANPSEPCFLSIDVEGAELDVLKTNDWKRFKPRLICIESWPGEANINKNKIEKLLEDQGYIKRSTTGLSTIYIAKSYLKNFENI